MTAPSSGFDVHALYAALDAQRQSRGMSWAQVAREISDRFGRTPARPLSPSTLAGMRERHSLEGDSVLQMLGWLHRSPESFLPGRNGESKASETLPQVGPSQILRFDTRALYRALDARRVERGMTWRQVAEEIGGFAATNLTSLAKGGRIAFPGVMRLVAWVGQPAVSFTRASDW